MTFKRPLTFALVVLALGLFCFVDEANGSVLGCWNTWSRCTGWSSAGTGWLWKSCEDRCKELGKRTGRCVLVPARDCGLTDKAYQCQCS